jgi:hypothetical protein
MKIYPIYKIIIAYEKLSWWIKLKKFGNIITDIMWKHNTFFLILKLSSN